MYDVMHDAESRRGRRSESRSLVPVEDDGATVPAEYRDRRRKGARAGWIVFVLVLLAVVFTLTIGLMGFVRAGIRETWHVYGVVRDTSLEAYTPTMGYAAMVIAAASLVFFALLLVIFKFGMGKEEQAT